MCRRVTCRQCKKPSWAGCGAHVEMVLGDVPRAERCQCRTGAAPRRRETTAVIPAESGSRLQRFRRWLGN